MLNYQRVALSTNESAYGGFHVLDLFSVVSARLIAEHLGRDAAWPQVQMACVGDFPILLVGFIIYIYI